MILMGFYLLKNREKVSHEILQAAHMNVPTKPALNALGNLCTAQH